MLNHIVLHYCNTLVLWMKHPRMTVIVHYEKQTMQVKIITDGIDIANTKTYHNSVR